MSSKKILCACMTWSLIVLLAIACQSSSTSIGREATPVSTLSPCSLECTFVEADDAIYTFPRPGTIVSLKEYKDQVCVTINALQVLEPGDFWEFDDVIRRTTIQVDNQTRQAALDSKEDFIVLGVMRNPQGETIASVGGPYKWCVSAKLSAGIHRVAVTFEKTSGEKASAAWTFELVSGPKPSATPPPTPQAAQIHRKVWFPDFIHDVFPAPGMIPPTEMNAERWTDLLNELHMPTMIITDPDILPVCVALSIPELNKLGRLPTWGSEAFNERFYLQVNGQIVSWQKSIQSHGSTVSWCALAKNSPGEHIVTLYIVTYDDMIHSYSWAFQIEESK